MSQLIPFIALISALLLWSFFRLRLWQGSLLSIGALALAYGLGQRFGAAHPLVNAAVWLPTLAGVVLLNVSSLRRSLLSAPFLRFYQRIAPALSETEQVALSAGTVGFEGELFSGKPDWSKLLSQPAPKLSAEEQAFVDGPCEEVCKMTNDWEVTHERADLSPEGRYE